MTKLELVLKSENLTREIINKEVKAELDKREIAPEDIILTRRIIKTLDSGIEIVTDCDYTDIWLDILENGV